MHTVSGFKSLVWICATVLAASLPACANNSRKIYLPYAMLLNATEIPAGTYKANCEYHGQDAIVTFWKGNQVIATAQGKLVQYKEKFSNEAIVFATNADGSHTLLEIRFGGMSEGIALYDPATRGD